MLWLAALATLALLAYWQYWHITHRRILELARQLPGPRAWPVVGNALWFFVKPGQSSNLLDVISKLTNKYGDYWRLWLGPDLNIVVMNPADIKLLLTSNKVNHKGPSYELTKTYIGPGILSGGSTWRNHRKIATPAYNKKSIQNYLGVFNAEASRLALSLRHQHGRILDLYADVVVTTTQCVCQTLMGLSKEDSLNVYRMDEVVFTTQSLYRHVFDKMTIWWLQIPFIYWLIGAKKKEDYYLKALDEFTSDIVRKRRRSLKKADKEVMGIVDRYILSGELSEQEIKWETFSLFTTSQEASAKIASGVLMVLAHLPEWQDLVYNEIQEVLNGHEEPSPEQLKQLKHLDMVFMETLRCFAIAAFIQRTVDEEITINDGKITLPKGTSLLIPMHDLHHDPRYWEEPLKIKPERFLPENVAKRDPNAFVPFSLGAMDCLGLSLVFNTKLKLSTGRVYATALIKTLVVQVLRQVQLEGVGSLDDLTLEVAISVKSARGYIVKVKSRGCDA